MCLAFLISLMLICEQKDLVCFTVWEALCCLTPTVGIGVAAFLSVLPAKYNRSPGHAEWRLEWQRGGQAGTWGCHGDVFPKHGLDCITFGAEDTETTERCERKHGP